MSILDPSFCPRCGTELVPREFEGEERMFCPECDFHVFHLPCACAGVAVVDGDRVLLVERGHPPHEGAWTIPAGVAEYGELPRETAARELFEETGVSVSPGALTLAGTGGDPNPDNHRLGLTSFDVYFAVDRESTEGVPSAGADAAAAKFWSPDDFVDAEEQPRPGGGDRLRMAFEALDRAVPPEWADG